MRTNSEKDYLAGVEWANDKYINSYGSITSGNSLHYTNDCIVLNPGEYVLNGTHNNTSAQL